MFLTVEPFQQGKYGHLLTGMFKLRARVFKDKLGWDVPVIAGQERDPYDDCSPLYLLATDETQSEVHACMRFLPTTGPTLLFDVFHETLPEAVDFESPFIWEGTRFCVDEDLLARRRPEVNPVRLSGQMLIASCEFALNAGIEAILANFDPLRLRIWRRAGAKVDVLGATGSFGERPVYLGLFEISEAVLANMRQRVGVDEPLLERRRNYERRIAQPVEPLAMVA